MIIDSFKLGQIKIADSQIHEFPEGLIGFPSMTKFALITDPQWEPFIYMQSLDLTSLCFVIVEAKMFFPEYSILLTDSELRSIQLEQDETPLVYLVLSVYKEIENTTANLKGPIVINGRAKIGKQLVLLNNRYSTKEKIFNFMEVENVSSNQRDQ